MTRFLITRTSYDARTYCDEPTEPDPLPAAIPGPLLTWGEAYHKQIWYVNLFTLDDLIAFQRVHGDVILRSLQEPRDGEGLAGLPAEWRTLPVLEIYDDYRE